MEICSAFIGVTFVILMLGAIQGRRKLIKYPCCPPGSVLDSATGLFILAAGAVSLWVMHRITNNTDNSVYLISSELTKLLTGAIGAMYLKQGYEKHDQEWEKNRQKQPLASPETSSASPSIVSSESGHIGIFPKTQNSQGDEK